MPVVTLMCHFILFYESSSNTSFNSRMCKSSKRRLTNSSNQRPLALGHQLQIDCLVKGGKNGER